MDARLPIALLLLVLLAGGLWWVVGQAPAAGVPGEYATFVVAPDGSLYANGTVHLDHANALSALQALASSQGFPVGVESSTGFSGCSESYVHSIGPYEETATGGWNYYTRKPGQDWTWSRFGAGCGLPAGVQVEWCWVEQDVCAHHAA